MKPIFLMIAAADDGQPPSGGCVLKHAVMIKNIKHDDLQPPSGGCVLKHDPQQNYSEMSWQPPSGGCVLKRLTLDTNEPSADAAAFGRLCVETR